MPFLRLWLAAGMVLVGAGIRAADSTQDPVSAWADSLRAEVEAAGKPGATNGVEKVLRGRLDLLPRQLVQIGKDEVLEKSGLLVELASRHLPSNSIVRLEALEHQARILIELKRVDLASGVLKEIALHNGLATAPQEFVIRFFEDFARSFVVMGMPSKALEVLNNPGFDSRNLDDKTSMRFRSLLAECYLDLVSRDPEPIQRATAILEADWQYYKKSHQTQTPEAATTLHLKARAARMMQRPGEGLELAQQAWNLRRKLLLPGNPDLASSERLLGKMLALQGSYSNAIDHLTSALPALLASFGPTHLEVVSTLQDLALCSQWSRQQTNALRWAEQLKSVLAQMVEEAAFSGDEPLLRFKLRLADPLVVPGTLTIDTDVRLAAASARYKGLPSRLRAEVRDLELAKQDPRSRNIAERWEANLNGRLNCQGRLLAGGKTEPECPSSDRSLEKDLTALGYPLGRIRRSLALGEDAYWKRFPSNAVLVDFVLHAQVGSPDKPETRLDAILYLPGKAPRTIRLPGNREIPKLVLDYTESLRNETGSGKTILGISRALRERLWDPIAAQLPPGCTNIVICPEGPLGSLSFASLAKADRLLGEEFIFRYIPSVAEVLENQPTKVVSKSASLFAHPEFDLKPVKGVSKEPRWKTLPTTLSEGVELEKVLTNRSWSVRLEHGRRFTKQAVLGTQSPGILLLASHGHWFPSVSSYSSSPGDQEAVRWAMRSSFVVVAGANWKVPAVVDTTPRMSGIRMEVPMRTESTEPNPEGYLTAGELEAADLNGTWLVILSGCSTGLGEFGDSDGVYGLQRATLAAGARNVLMTAWPIWSITTSRLLPAIVANGLDSGDLATALSRQIADAMRHERVDNLTELDKILRRFGPYMLLTREL